jgi:hypothetical protein
MMEIGDPSHQSSYCDLESTRRIAVRVDAAHRRKPFAGITVYIVYEQ